MGITINPIDAIKSIVTDRREKRQRAAEYLETVAAEATALADIWKEVVDELLINGVYEISEDIRRKNLLILSGRVRMCNAMRYSRLEEHFREVSSVLGINYHDEMNSVVYHISGLLQRRNITKEMIENELAYLNGKIIHKDNKINDFRNLQTSVNGLYKEASALHVRAKSFKAK